MPNGAMSTHPDIVELRDKYEAASQTPVLQAIDGLTFMAGMYLAMSPWIVGFNGFTTLAGANLIAGAALAMLAFGFASAYGRTHGLTWVAPLIGVWAIIAPWVVSGDVSTTATVWSNVVVGAVAIVLGLGAMLTGMRETD